LRWSSCLLLITAGRLVAGASTFDFEGFAEGTHLLAGYTGLTFSNATVLTKGFALNEFECPPHSGANVVFDDGGPVTITFSSPAQVFSGYFTYTVPVTIQAFDSSNHLAGSVASAFSNNLAVSGVSGSVPNELIKISAAGGIAKVVITGASSGSSFVLDDVSFGSPSKCDLNPSVTPNVADVQVVINQVLGTTAATNDLNQDGTVNVVNAQIVINAALGFGCLPG
jgi:hypothetical protein